MIGQGIPWENAPRWMLSNLTDHMVTLVQLMPWCRQATSHYLRHSWHIFMSPYGVIWPQWINSSNICVPHKNDVTALFEFNFCNHVLISIHWYIAGCPNTHGIVKDTITVRPRQNGHYFPDDTFKCIFVNENVWISIKMSLTLVLEGPSIGLDNVLAPHCIVIQRQSLSSHLSCKDVLTTKSCIHIHCSIWKKMCISTIACNRVTLKLNFNWIWNTIKKHYWNGPLNLAMI